jgi:predicted nucleic acid-binding protein
MTTSVDSSVLLDLLTGDDRFAEAAIRSLRAGRARGRLLVNELVVAEVRPALNSDSELEEFLSDLGLDFESLSYEDAVLAGSMYRSYLGNRGAAKRVLPDFLIGAQACRQGFSLLARDRGYYRQYFQGLTLIEPGI